MNENMDVIKDGAIAIKEGTIAALGTRDQVAGAFTASQTINATGKLVMPGLINTHTHTPMTVLRGYGDDMTLDEWLNKSIWPWEKKHVNPDTVRANSRLAIIEMIREGTTTFADMYFYGTATAPLASEIGMRAVLGEAYAEGGPYSFDHTVQATGELMEQ
jgi:5-methylthioadenosine/S-adenosylhomocysteine deaminase